MSSPLKSLSWLLFLSVLLAANAQTNSAPAASDANVDALLDDVQHRAFLFFWNECNPTNGLIRDRASNSDHPSRNKNIASIAAVGFGLTAYPVGIEHGWITRQEGIDRTKATLRTFQNEVEGTNGFYFHFVDTDTGKRAWHSELSSIDTGLFLCGALMAREYYGDKEITQYADELFERCEFNWMANSQPFLYMSWTPEHSFSTYYWSNYNEGLLLTLLAIGSPTHPIDPKTWSQVRRKVGSYHGQTMVSCPPLFTHQYPHLWLDLRGKNDGVMDYFENSRRATLINRQFCIDQASKFKGYAEDCWGLSACDGPSGYKAYGAPPGKAPNDGTLAPTAALTSIMFTPELSKAALLHFRALEPSIWGKYGFAGSFNSTRSWIDPEVIGIDQGAILLGIENARTGFIWKQMMKNSAIQSAMQKIGFQQGTIELKLEEQPSYRVARAKSPVKLDGNSEEWTNAPEIKLNPSQFLESGAIGSEADCSASIRFLWDEHALYVLVIVKDDEVVHKQTRNDQIWRDDCLELYFDPQGDGLMWNDPKDFQIGISPGFAKPRTYAWFQKMEPKADQIDAAQSITPDGYVLEAAISWSFLGITPAAGATIFASPAVHDRDEQVKSEGKLMWFFEDMETPDRHKLGKLELQP